MALSNDLIAQFVKVTNDNTKNTKETTIVYGTTVVDKGKTYVKLDGSEVLTPISATADAVPGERVTVMIKNHTATITGNISSPAARVADVKNIQIDSDGISSKITEFEILIADKVDTDQLNAQTARIDALVTDNVLIKNSLYASEAEIDELQAADVTITDSLNANTADISTLKTDKLDVTAADAKFATIESLDATNADIYNLEATYGEFSDLTTERLDAMDARIKELAVGDLSAVYANIDFSNISTAAIEKIFADTGLIQDIVVGDGIITGRLVGVTISGDLIEGNTVKAEKLVIKGSDGIYYKLNTDGVTTEAEQTDQNSLNGSVIKAKSIAATKISVSDLVAFDATIGGFNITESAIYSGAKESVDNTTRGIYLDNDGQAAFGDANNFIKYYKESDGSYKLEISSVENLAVGGRNLLQDSTNLSVNSAASGLTSSTSEDGYLQITAESGNSNWVSMYLGSNYTEIEEELSEGDEFVISFTMRSSDATTPPSIYVKSGMGYYSMKGTVSSTWSTVWYAGTWKDTNNITPHFGFSDLVGTYEIKNCKIEKGNKPTDWTPAPEDMATANQLTEAKTEISQNSEAILLRATKKEVTDAVDAVEIGGRNLASVSRFTADSNVYSTAEFELRDCWATSYIQNEQLVDMLEPGTEYTIKYDAELIERTDVPTAFDMMFGFLIYSSSQGTWISLGSNMSDDSEVGTKQTICITFTTPDAWNDEAILAYSRRWTTEGSEPIGHDTFKITNFKIEKGNKATDWTPAPEDMATADDVENVQSIADEASSSAAYARTLIAQLSDSISMLVTDGNGTSLMTQTETGWMFSTAEIQDSINNTSEGLDSLINDVGEVGDTVNILQQAVDELGTISDYVKIGTYEDEPCIELGESDSDFKLIITNTRIMFMEDSDVPAYISNQALNIKKAVIEEEFRQGDFVWKVRSNGNLGLTWRGDE